MIELCHCGHPKEFHNMNFTITYNNDNDGDDEYNYGLICENTRGYVAEFEGSQAG
jgi:hypothetical protein